MKQKEQFWNIMENEILNIDNQNDNKKNNRVPFLKMFQQ